MLTKPFIYTYETFYADMEIISDFFKTNVRAHNYLQMSRRSYYELLEAKTAGHLPTKKSGVRDRLLNLTARAIKDGALLIE